VANTSRADITVMGFSQRGVGLLDGDAQLHHDQRLFGFQIRVEERQAPQGVVEANLHVRWCTGLGHPQHGRIQESRAQTA